MTKKPALGFLISGDAFEVLALGVSSGKYYVSHYAWSRLPKGIIENDKVVDSRALAEQIKNLIASARPKPPQGPVVLGLPQSRVFLKVFTFPKLEHKSLEETVKWYLESLSAVIPSNAYTSYEVVERKETGEIRILLAAAQKEIVDPYIESFMLAGNQVAIVEPTVIAKTRLINPQQLLGKSVISLHLYWQILTASILVNGKSWFSRESTLAKGDEETIKLATTEITDYFTKIKEKDIPNLTEIIYSGDRAGVEVLKKTIPRTRLAIIKAEPGLILRPSQVTTDIETAAFAPVLGLALKGRLDQKGTINLLPDWPKQKVGAIQLSQVFSLWLGVAIILIWSIAGLLIGTRWWLKEEYQRLEKNKNEISLDETQERELLVWKSEFNNRAKAAKKILASQKDYYQILSQLAALVPKKARITSFVYRSLMKEWSLTGIADRREDVLALDRELKNSEIFNDARLFFSSLDNSERVIFRFTGAKNDN